MEQNKHIGDAYYQGVFKKTYFLSVIICVVGFFVNALYVQNFPFSILALLAGLTLGFIYHYTHKNNVTLGIHLYIIISFISINIAWFYSNGILGSTPFMFIVLSTVATSLIQLKNFPYYLTIISVNLLVLVLIQSYYPPSFAEFPNFERQKLEITLLTLATILLSNISIVYFKVLDGKRQAALKEKNLSLIASKKALEIAKEEAEKASKVKSEFLSVVSHEVRTPLNAILGISNLLNQYQYDNQEKTELVTTLKHSTHDLLNLLNDVLDFNKLEMGQIELNLVPVNIVPLLKEIKDKFTSTATEKENRLSLNTIGNIPTSILVDEKKLRQVLNKLISNAIKYTSKGTIEINIQQLHSKNNKTSLLFEIKDTGMGIAVNEHQSIFQEFNPAPINQKTSSNGLGLGLTITAGLLKLMDSEIQVESNLNKGTRFYFTLECASPVVQEVKPLSVLKNSRKNSKILLVEDNKTNVLVLTHFLKKWGIAYEIAWNGAEALSFFRKETFNLILMDMQMPVMDGFEATEEIRKANRSIPIIALTASATAHEKERAKIAGVNDYITKPFDPKHLLKVIHAHTLV